jgi:hypothetical protein
MKGRESQVRDLGQLYTLDSDSGRPSSLVGAVFSQDEAPELVCFYIVRTSLTFRDLLAGNEPGGKELYYMRPDDARSLARQLQTAAAEACKGDLSEGRSTT